MFPGRCPVEKKQLWDLSSFQSEALRCCPDEAPIFGRLIAHVNDRGGTLTFGKADSAAVTGNYVVSETKLPIWTGTVGIGGGPHVYDSPTIYLYLSRIDDRVSDATFALFIGAILQIPAYAQRLRVNGYVTLSRGEYDLDGLLDAFDIVIDH